MASQDSPILVPCYMEKDYLKSLNDRFASYVTHMRQIREQHGELETTNLLKTTKTLEDEIVALKSTYERQLEELRKKLEEIAHERTQHQLAASKNSALVADLQDKLAKATRALKETESALADAQRVIVEKESLLQDARVTATQLQNSLVDTKQDRDGLQSILTQTQQALDTEVAAKADLQTLTNQLKEQLNFQQQLHEKELHEMRLRLEEAKNIIISSEKRLRDGDISEDKLSTMLARVKMQGEEELRRFKEESEISFESRIQHLKMQLDNETRSLSAARDENIQLKAQVEALDVKTAKLKAKCSSLETQKAGLSQNLEKEHQQATNTIRSLEAKLRDGQETLRLKVQELSHAHNSHLPLDLELDAFASLLEAEERRLNLEVESKHPSRPVCFHTCHSTSTENVIDQSTKDTTTALSAMHPSTITSTVTQLKTTSGALSDSKLDPVVQPITSTSSHRHISSYKADVDDYPNWTPSHTGNVCILEVSPDGNYVRIFNTSSFKDEEIGGYMVQQNVAGRPVSVFRFPPRTTLKALSHATVWSAASVSRHNPPSDFLYKDQHKWRTGPGCTTVLCKPDGQVVAWTTVTVPKKKEAKPFYDLPSDPRLSHGVELRFTNGDHQNMSVHLQAVPQGNQPDPSWASRNTGALLRRFTGTSLPNSKNASPKNSQGGSIHVLPVINYTSPSEKHQDRRRQINSRRKVRGATVAKKYLG